MVKDSATSPEHYKKGGLQVISILKKKMSPEEFKGFCKGNVLKYVLRADDKNGSEDLEKALVYLKWLIKAKKEEENAHSQHLSCGESGTV